MLVVVVDINGPTARGARQLYPKVLCRSAGRRETATPRSAHAALTASKAASTFEVSVGAAVASVKRSYRC